MPTAEQLSRNKSLSFLGGALKDPHLWLLHRRPVALGVAIGLFSAYLPMPFETVIAVILAIYFRANIPIAFAFVFVSNPLTWAILYTPAYKLGALITNPDVFSFSELLNPENYRLDVIFGSKDNNILYQYFTLWVGCLIVGPVVAFVGYFSSLWAWELHIVSRWKNRKLRRKLKAKKKNL